MQQVTFPWLMTEKEEAWKSILNTRTMQRPYISPHHTLNLNCVPLLAAIINLPAHWEDPIMGLFCLVVKLLQIFYLVFFPHNIKDIKSSSINRFKYCPLTFGSDWQSVYLLYPSAIFHRLSGGYWILIVLSVDASIHVFLSTNKVNGI